MILMFPLTASAGNPADFDPAWVRFQTYFSEVMKEDPMVGGAVWFFHEGRPSARLLHGMADVAENRRVDEDTIFHWGSVTKTLTGIAILQLRDRGLLDLDDPVVLRRERLQADCRGAAPA